MFLSNPSFVLAIVATSSFFSLPSVVAEKEGNFYQYAGFVATTDVEDIAKKDLIQKEFESILKGDGTEDSLCDNLDAALDYYQNGEGKFLQDLPTYTDTKSRTWEINSAFYDDDDYFNSWVTAALTGNTFFNGAEENNFEFDKFDIPCLGRQEATKKGSAFISGQLEVAQFMEEALQLVKDGCDDQHKPCSTAINAWNKAGAYFVGSLEGPRGVFTTIDDNGVEIDKKPYGKGIYGLGDKRCANFKTCGVNGDSGAKNLTAKTNIVIISLLAKGGRQVFAGDVNGLNKTILEITSQINVMTIQGSLRYGYRLGNKNKGGSDEGGTRKAKELAEGATFAAAAAPLLWACDIKAGEFVATQYQIAKKSIADKDQFDFNKVKLAFECNYKCLGISCSDVGVLFDGAPEQLAPGCTDLEECKKEKKKDKKKCKKFRKKPNKEEF